MTEHDAALLRTGDSVYTVSRKGRGVFEWIVLALPRGATVRCRSVLTGEHRDLATATTFWNTADAFEAMEPSCNR